MVDVLIIGGGPIGMACGIAAIKAGLTHLIIEKGCLTNSLYHYPQGMTFFSTAEKLEIGNLPFVSTNPKPKRAEALEYYRRVALTYSLNIRLFEEAQQIRKDLDVFTVVTSKGNFRAKKVIVATGFYDIPITMDVPGENLAKVRHYYSEPHYYAHQNVVVVGASNSSVDAALETYRKGASVTMVVRGPHISPRVKYWVKPDIENRITFGEIKAYFNSSIREITEDKVLISTPDGEVTLENDFVLALTGYRPDFDFLKRIGIQLDKDNCFVPQYDPETMETNVKGLFLAGVVCGGLNTHTWFIENSRVHAEQIIRSIQFNK
jgi:thioredoxin reductase (NADPH)